MGESVSNSDTCPWEGRSLGAGPWKLSALLASPMVNLKDELSIGVIFSYKIRNKGSAWNLFMHGTIWLLGEEYALCYQVQTSVLFLRPRIYLFNIIRWQTIALDIVPREVGQSQRTNGVWSHFCECLEKSHLQAQTGERGSPGAGGRQMGSWCLMRMEFRDLQDESLSGGWLHNRVNVINTIELHT